MLDPQQKLKDPRWGQAGRTARSAQVSHLNVTSKLAPAGFCSFTRAFLVNFPHLL